jgi:ABC-type lipopolysaccharide export system ATPase subunit
MTTPAIAVTGLRKKYGNKTVLDGIDIHVARGTVFALLGPDGAGKTTGRAAGPAGLAPRARRGVAAQPGSCVGRTVRGGWMPLG